MSLRAAGRGGRVSALEDEVAALFVEMRPAVLRYAASLGLGTTDAEDVAQDTFLALYRHLGAGKPRTNLRGWIFRVTHNLALKRRAASGLAAEADLEGADPGPTPEDAAAANQRQARLRAVVNALPERERQCLYLRAEGLSYREIASALDISLGTVALSLSRSLAKLSAVGERD
ncbi:MAG: sigma-70 family RNA polymerase sigma factor [Bryobacteraceae bacterium]